MNLPPVTDLSALSPVDKPIVAPRRADVAVASPEPAKASEPLNLSGTAVAARALAEAPPIDEARIASLRARIANGSYVPDPAAIADRMMALDLPGE